MTNTHQYSHVTDEERREFLKALGVGGAVAAGAVTLNDVRDGVSAGDTSDLAPTGRAIRSDLDGALDADLLADRGAAFAAAAGDLPAAVERGLPGAAQRDEFGRVVEAARPVYDHLAGVGFFESTTEHLPAFTPDYLEQSVRAFVADESLADPLRALGFEDAEAVDLVATVISNAEALDTYHWVATDEIPRERLEVGEYVPPMTRAAAGGTLLWLDDLDEYLWKMGVLLTDEILADATWHARSMAAGFELMTEGARQVAAGSGSLSDAELGAVLSTGFALQAVAQNLLPRDVYWVTEEMRAERRTDLATTETN